MCKFVLQHCNPPATRLISDTKTSKLAIGLGVGVGTVGTMQNEAEGNITRIRSRKFSEPIVKALEASANARKRTSPLIKSPTRAPTATAAGPRCLSLDRARAKMSLDSSSGRQTNKDGKSANGGENESESGIEREDGRISKPLRRFKNASSTVRAHLRDTAQSSPVKRLPTSSSFMPPQPDPQVAVSVESLSKVVDIAKEPRSCLAIMISRAVNVQSRSRSTLLSSIHTKAVSKGQGRTTKNHSRKNNRVHGQGSSGGSPATSPLASKAPSDYSNTDLWNTVRSRDETGLWIPDFSKTRPINVEGFFTGIDYAPQVFESIREHFGIQSRQFAADLGRLGEGKEGEGKSKQLFFMVG